jgi:carboxyl-terminal processing protease
MRKAPLIVSAFAAIVVSGAAGSKWLLGADADRPLALLDEALTIVHNKYVDDVPWAKLVRDGTVGMVEALDADSVLLGPPQSRALGGTAHPDDGDVGIVLGRRRGGLTVIAARDGTPARQAGLQAGDVLLSIDGVSTQRMLPIEAATRLRGRSGTDVTVRVARTGWAEPKPLSLMRTTPPADSVSDRALGEGIIYVRIPALRDATAAEFAQLLRRPPADRAAGLVLDLRNTPHGHVSAAVTVAGMFLDPGCVVTRVESREPNQPRELLTSAAPGRFGQPMAVLVNHGTESAAEVLAGALQDWGRAVIVGSPTYGDASAQSRIPLPDGQTLDLTTARYLTPKGRVISGKGIVPDVVVGTPATADLRPVATEAKPGSRDPEVEMAFDLVKAARIFDQPSRGEVSEQAPPVFTGRIKEGCVRQPDARASG